MNDYSDSYDYTGNTVKTLKLFSREALLGHYSAAAGAFLVSEVIVAALGAVFISSGEDTFSVITAAVSSLIIALLACILDTGIAHFHLNVARGYPAKISDVFYGFKLHPDRILSAALTILIINIIAAVPFIAVGAWYLLRNGINAARFFLYLISGAIMILPVKMYSLMGVLFLLWAVAAIAVNIGFSFVFYVFLDNPSLTTSQLLSQSRQMMRGRQLKMLWLYLSFIGMFLLGVLSLGIGFLWVSPYLHSTITYFYLDALNNNPGES